jgi:membrane protein YqaA with SNARE-associated domain
MKHLVETIEAFALSLGGPGLFLIAYLDSSFLSFPQANDLLIIVMVLKHKHLMLFYASMATLGSAAGCLTIYALARKGGEAFLQKRFRGGKADRVRRLFEKYGVLAVIIPSLLPPPAPFKLFVLMAGVAQMPALTFGTAVVLGRGIRYFGVGLLTVWYGDAAAAFLRSHGRLAWAVLAGLAVLGAVLWAWRRKLAVSGAGSV